MKIIGLGQLHQYCRRHPDCERWLQNWIADVRAANWKTPHDIRERYATASFLPDRVVIFNVRGNNHRLETQIAFETQIVAVKWIGPHADYTRRHR